MNTGGQVLGETRETQKDNVTQEGGRKREREGGGGERRERGGGKRERGLDPSVGGGGW